MSNGETSFVVPQKKGAQALNLITVKFKSGFLAGKKIFGIGAIGTFIQWCRAAVECGQ